jgi:hypothetical protein|tara:strand:- start:124 stop:303 length:180 start_codon:yes stop_codon:yes gene_type:complete
MDKVKITDEFYLEKFMELQRANIVLWRRLKTLEQEKNIRETIETLVDENFFNGLDDLVK